MCCFQNGTNINYSREGTPIPFGVFFLSKSLAQKPFCSIIPRMLTLRLQRVGRKHDPSYRIVATNSRNGPKSGNAVEVLGHYDAIRKTRTIKADAVKKHLANGATVSNTLRNILISEGILEGKKVNALSKKSPIIDEEALKAEAEAKAKAEEEKKAAEEAAAAEQRAASEEVPSEESTEEASEEQKED